MKKIALIFSITLIYFSIFSIFSSNSNVVIRQLYDVFFSLDSGYYNRFIFLTPDIQWDGQIARHPLYPIYGHIIANIKNTLLHWFNFIPYVDSPLKQYSFIVLVQCFITACTIYFIYKYLIDVVNLSKKMSLLLTILYAVSMSTIVFTIFIETFALSAFFLVLMIYFVQKKQGNILLQVGLGVGLIGTTITNGIVWIANLLIHYSKNHGKIITVCILTIIAFMFLLFSQSYGYLFLTKGLDSLLHTANSSNVNYEGVEWLKAIFNFLIVAPFFGLSIEQRLFDTGEKGLFFLNEAAPLSILAGLIWTGLLLYSLFILYRNKNTWILYTVLIFNFTLHGILQFYLHEGFLYSQHHAFAQIFLVGHTFKHLEKKKWLYFLVSLLIIISLISNIESLKIMYTFAIEYAPK
ncbi:DUF6080 domain-containing protein [Bacillaceae bacterium CLA-AA-H227]|uniref:DUF6080 domain-containing protein n=1 Tax=Robertmurraya yapensis (ex Hitch et al 2024) TaxID=3133160 RepID=A0ACC6SBR2_9BACI